MSRVCSGFFPRPRDLCGAAVAFAALERLDEEELSLDWLLFLWKDWMVRRKSGEKGKLVSFTVDILLLDPLPRLNL